MSGYSPVLVVLLAVTAVSGTGNCSWTILRENVEATDIHCLEYWLSHYDCVRLNNADLPILDDDRSIEKPYTFKAVGDKVVVNESNVQVTGSQVNFLWSPPQSGLALSSLKGFMMNGLCLIGEKCESFCVIFDVRNATFNSRDKMLKFKWQTEELFLTHDTFMEYNLYSLPRSPQNREYVTRSISLPAKSDGIVYPFAWKAILTTEVMNITTLKVSFKFPQLNFTQYDVYLWKDGGSSSRYIINQFQGQEFGEHVFENLANGNYTVGVKPKEINNNDEELCLCYKIVDSKKSCKSCTGTKTSVISIVNPGFTESTTTSSLSTVIPTSSSSTENIKTSSSSTENIKTSSSSTENTKTSPLINVPEVGSVKNKHLVLTATEIALIVIGAVLAVFIILVIVFYVCKKRNKKCDLGTRYFYPAIPPPDQANIAFSSIPVQKKTVFILNAEDHKHHVDAVKQLVDYLQNVGHCNVIYPPYKVAEMSQMTWNGWLLKSLDQANFVIIVNSEALYKIMKADIKNEKYNYKPITATGHLILDFIKVVIKESKKSDSLDKYIHVFLDHSSPDHLLVDLNTQQNVRIVSELGSLNKCIHKPTGGMQIHPELSEALSSEVDDTEAGRCLRDAVRKAHTYEKSHVLWFDEQFGQAYDRENNTCSIDSGNYSVQTDPNSPTYSESCFPFQTNDPPLPTQEDKRSIQCDDMGFYPPDDYVDETRNSQDDKSHLDDWGFYPPESMSQISFDNGSFMPPETLSELECQSISPSAYIRTMNDQNDQRLHHIEESDEPNIFFTSNSNSPC